MQAATANDTLIYCAEGPIVSVSPPLSNVLGNKKLVHRNVFDQLVEFDQNGSLLPGLAMSWKVSQDGLNYDFYLRKGVRFHDSVNGFQPSRDFNAHDVEYTFMRYQDPQHPLHNTPQTKGGFFPYWQGQQLDQIVSEIKPLDDYTLRIKLKRPLVDFLPTLATSAFSIYSEEYGTFVVWRNNEYLQAHPGTPADSKDLPINWYDTQPVGTGPFRLVGFQSGGIELEAMHSHFQGKPQLAHVSVIPVVDPVERAKRVLDGRCHIASDPLVADYDSLQGTSSDVLDFQSTLTRNISYLTVGPAVSAEVRPALSMALDRAKYVSDVFDGHGRAVGSLMDASQLGNDYPVPENFQFNREKAIASLQAMPNARKNYTLLYLPASRPFNTDPHHLAEKMKGDLEAVGFKIRLATVGFDKQNNPTLIYDDSSSTTRPDAGAYARYIMKGLHEIAQYGDNPVIPSGHDRYLNAVTSGIPQGDADGTNYSHWSNAHFDVNYAKIVDPAYSGQLHSLFRDSEAVLATEIPYIPVLSTEIFRIIRKSVKGYQLHPLHIERFYNVSFDYDPQ